MDNSSASDDMQPTTMGTLVHLIGFVSGPFGAGLVARHSKNEFTEVNAQNALNWQLTVSGAVIAVILVSIVLINLGANVLLTYVALLLMVAVFNLASCLLAAYKATHGEAWEYPFEQQFV